MDTPAAFRLRHIELSNLLHYGTGPNRHPREPQPGRVDFEHNERNHCERQNTQKGEKHPDASPRDHVRGVDVHLLVVDAVLVAVRGVEVEAPEEDEKADRGAMRENFSHGLFLPVDRGPACYRRVGDSQAEDVLRVDEDFAEDGPFQVRIKSDAGC